MLHDSRRGCEPVHHGVPGHILMPPGWGIRKQNGAGCCDSHCGGAGGPGRVSGTGCGDVRHWRGCWGLPGHGYQLAFAAGGLRQPPNAAVS